jgi:hypothetical protein
MVKGKNVVETGMTDIGQVRLSQEKKGSNGESAREM